MTATGIGAYTPEDAREIKRRVLGKSKGTPNPHQYGGPDKLGWHYGVLKEALAVATNPLTGYTQANCAVLMYQEGEDTLDMVEVDGEHYQLPITNRSLTFSADAGDVILFRWVVKEWVPIVGGGSGNTASAGNCPCLCIENGDIEVGSVETTSEWYVTLSAIKDPPQANGWITLPAGTYRMLHVGSGVWTLDIGEFLIATYNDGDDATADTTMDGTLTFTMDDAGYTVLELCITGTVPEDPSS
jgi:hypothetical protein